MATRFYFSDFNDTPNISPAVDSNWEQTGSLERDTLIPKLLVSRLRNLSGPIDATVPITTTQDIVHLQFISNPIPAQYLAGTVSMVMRFSENVSTVNVTLAVVIRVLSRGGESIRGTLFSVFGTDTAYALGGSDATRIVNSQTLTPLITQPGDRLVVEIGGRATAPSTSGTFKSRYGFSAATDFALTSGLTTDLNPWIEFSQNIFDGNYLRNVNRGLRPHPFSPGLAR